MAGMAADPVPFDLVLGERRREPLPEVLVFHRLAAGGFPAVGAPAMDPARDAVPQIDAVRVDADLYRALQRTEERRVGKECVRTCRSRGLSCRLKKNNKQK